MLQMRRQTSELKFKARCSSNSQGGDNGESEGITHPQIDEDVLITEASQEPRAG